VGTSAFQILASLRLALNQLRQRNVRNKKSVRHPEQARRKASSYRKGLPERAEGPSPFYRRTSAARRTPSTQSRSHRPFAEKRFRVCPTVRSCHTGPSSPARRNAAIKQPAPLASAQDDGALRVCFSLMRTRAAKLPRQVRSQVQLGNEDAGVSRDLRSVTLPAASSRPCGRGGCRPPGRGSRLPRRCSCSGRRSARDSARRWSGSARA
jgi:hypothetical protein